MQTDEPPLPRKLAPRIHRDLETVCLKAMAKVPSLRYASAVALAEDLERFCVGEAILARRESLPARLWRRVRRSPITTISPVVVLLAVAIASYVVWNSRHFGRVHVAVSEFEAGLKVDDWTATHLEAMESRLEELHRLDPDSAGAARRRLNERYVAFIRELFRRPNVPPEDVSHIEAALTLLSTRAPQSVPALRQELQQRLRRWEPVGELTAPFDNVDAIFAAGTVQREESRVFVTAPTGDKPPVFIRTRAPCLGNVQLVMDVAAGWSALSQIGLVLHAQATQGYSFVLHAPGVPVEWPLRKASAAGAAVSLATVRQGGGVFQLVILRNGVRLREHEVHATNIPEGPLRLLASREGDRLTFQVNALPPVTFQDLFPLSTGDSGTFGVFCPDGVRLARLQMFRQALPVAPRTLERGDELFSRGQWAEALSHYQQDAISSTAPDAVQEARYKEGLCLAALNRSGEAVPLFERLIAESGSRWPPLAGCQLWLIHLRQNRLEEAEAVLDLLTARHGQSFQSLAALIPDDVRERILEKYTTRGSNFLLLAPEELLRTCERALQTRELLDPKPHNIDASSGHFWAKHTLIRACDLAGQGNRAVQLAEELLQEYGFDNSTSLEQYFWVLRHYRGPRAALDALNRWPEKAAKVVAARLLLERARTHATMEDWDKAEQHLDALLRRPDKKDQSAFVAADFIRGFLRERRGDLAGAREAWSRSLSEFRHASLPQSLDQVTVASGISHGAVVQRWILGSLTNELTDDEALADLALMTGSLAGSFAGDSSGANAFRILPIPPAAIREMWQTPRGHAWARRIAFRDLSFGD